MYHGRSGVGIGYPLKDRGIKDPLFVQGAFRKNNSEKKEREKEERHYKRFE